MAASGTKQDHGWFSYTGSGDNSHLTDEQRQIVEERIRSRGQLLGVVLVKVFENAASLSSHSLKVRFSGPIPINQ